MRSIIPELSRSEKRRLRVLIHREANAPMRTRMLMLLHLSKGKSIIVIAENLHLARSTVYRVAERFRVMGWAGLADRREDNGRSSVDEMFLLELRKAVSSSPQEYGCAADVDAGVVV